VSVEDANPKTWETMRNESLGFSGIRLPERYRETLTFIRPGSISKEGWYLVADEDLADALISTLLDDPDEFRLAMLRRLAGEERYRESVALLDSLGTPATPEDVLSISPGP
jgi:hypothetical protein